MHQLRDKIEKRILRIIEAEGEADFDGKEFILSDSFGVIADKITRAIFDGSLFEEDDRCEP